MGRKSPDFSLEGVFLGGGKNDAMLVFGSFLVPTNALKLFHFLSAFVNSYDVVDSICSQSQVKPASGGKLEAFKGLVRAHVAHRPLLSVAQV